MAGELIALCARTRAGARERVFRGLAGGRLQPTILAAIIRRSAQRARPDKHVTAHTLRHTSATWLRHATGDARLVAEHLGHSDLATVQRYAHVAHDEPHAAGAAIAAQAGPAAARPRAAGARLLASGARCAATPARWSGVRAERFHRDRRRPVSQPTVTSRQLLAL